MAGCTIWLSDPKMLRILGSYRARIGLGHLLGHLLGGYESFLNLRNYTHTSLSATQSRYAFELSSRTKAESKLTC